MKRRRRLLLVLGALALAGAGCGPRGTPRAEVVVFAAASLRDVAAEVGAAFEDAHGAAVVLSFAGSNVLARQILASPQADVFLSADAAWVEELERAGRTVGGSRRAIFGNRLVVIARRDAALGIEDLDDLATAGYRHLALADPSAVPAGRYARACLEATPAGDGNLWQAVAKRVVPALDVRAALALVESDPRIAGIVYATDARSSPEVEILCELPPRPDVAIRYWAVQIAGGPSPDLGRRFLDFVAGPRAAAIAARYGFLPPER